MQKYYIGFNNKFTELSMYDLETIITKSSSSPYINDFIDKAKDLILVAESAMSSLVLLNKSETTSVICTNGNMQIKITKEVIDENSTNSF